MIYALDFDGVVIDSIDECLHNSYSSYAYFRNYIGNPIPLHPTNDQINLFKIRRGLVRPSRNFYTLWEWIFTNPELEMNIDSFEKFALNKSDESMSFERIFHQRRSDLINENPKVYLDQNPLFVGVKETWQQLPKNLYIVSTKDYESISLILQAHGLQVEGIYGRGTGPKGSTIKKLATQNQLPIDNTYFVDDNSQHALDVKNVGSNVALAKWGYGPFDGFDGTSLNSFVEVLEFFPTI